MAEQSPTLLGCSSSAEKAIDLENLKLVELYISARNAERGLTSSGERWIRTTLPRFALAMQDSGIGLLAAPGYKLKSGWKF